MLKIILVLILTGLSAYSDYKTVKIRNTITVPFMILGLIIGAINGEFATSIVGVILPFIIFFIPWRMRLIGAGDVKEFMAIGSVLGFRLFVNTLFPIFVMQLILWIIVSKFSIKTIRGRFKFLFSKIKFLTHTGTILHEDEFKQEDMHTIKLAYGIMIGFIIGVIINYYQIALIFYNMKY